MIPVWRVSEIRIVFEPRDLWVGVYWDRQWFALVVYICLIPMLPLKIVLPGLRRNRRSLDAPNWPNG